MLTVASFIAGLILGMWDGVKIVVSIVSYVVGYATYIMAVILIAFWLYAAIASIAGAAHAHSFYDWTCCHDIDCAPVKSFTPTTDGKGYLVVLENGLQSFLRKNYLEAEGTGQNPLIKSSPDTRLHACIMKKEGVSYVRCIYIPGAN